MLLRNPLHCIFRFATTHHAVVLFPRDFLERIGNTAYGVFRFLKMEIEVWCDVLQRHRGPRPPIDQMFASALIARFFSRRASRADTTPSTTIVQYKTASCFQLPACFSLRSYYLSLDQVLTEALLLSPS